MTDLLGVASLLDDFHDAEVRRLWQALRAHCGWTGPNPEEVPHFTWHVAESYDHERLADALQEFCSHLAPFKVLTAGLGIFTAEKLVVYLPLVKDPVLMRIHQTLWDILGKLGQGISPYYSPERWMPHITLVYDNVGEGSLGCLVQQLAREPLSWVIPVDNLVMFGHAASDQIRPLVRFPLTGTEQPYAGN